MAATKQHNFDAFTGCPRCIKSLLLCTCQLVPAGHQKILALTPEQYTEWKRAGKVTTKTRQSVTIGIVGSRKRDTERDYHAVRKAFLKVYHPGDSIISGGCPKGGDHFAECISQDLKVPITIHLPDKTQLDAKLLKANPRAAYAVINNARNTLIANGADVLIACVSKDRTGGTEDTIKKFCKRFGRKEASLVEEGKLILV